MTRERFIQLQIKRGYEVEVLSSKVVAIHSGNYTAIHFFNEDGSPDITHTPCWSVTVK